MKKTNPLVFAVLATLMFANLSGCLSQSTEETFEDDAPTFDGENQATLTTHCAEIADVERCWMLLVPEQLEADKAVPMVLDLHGGGGTNSLQYNMSGFAQLAEEQGFIVAYPQAHGERNWDIDIDGLRNDYDDMGYLMRIINVTSEEHLVDTNRLYMTGWSNGCMMTQRFAVETQSVLASAGCMSGYLMKEAPATSSRTFQRTHSVSRLTTRWRSATMATVTKEYTKAISSTATPHHSPSMLSRQRFSLRCKGLVMAAAAERVGGAD